MTKIQALRIRKHWSPARLGVEALCTERTILNHEQRAGFRASPRVQARIAEALGVKVSTIFKEGWAR